MHAVAHPAHDHPRLPLVILASSSPRRRALFEDAGIPHAVHPSTVDDGLLTSGRVHPTQWVGSLAYYKASSTFETLDQDTRVGAVVLGADTVCVQGDQIIGQPNDRADAGRIIRFMSDNTHDVLTGVALINPETGQREIFVDRSVVTVGKLSEEQIETYLDSGDWKGKAGAYNITERRAAGWPITFEGDETSIVGLPMTRTLERIAAFRAL